MAAFARAQENQPVFATYFGGRDADLGTAVAPGPGGDIWFAGETHSTDLRVQAAYQPQCVLSSLQSCYDGFLARLSGDGQVLRYATYLGGRANDSITALVVDEQGYAYVTGTYNDGALAARFDPLGKPVYVISLGGPPLTIGHALALDRAGNLYITGQTSSGMFPNVNAPYPSQGPGSCQAIGGGTFPIDAFVAKISPTGNILLSTYLPGNGNDFGYAIAVDTLGRISVAGGTTSTNLPLPRAIQSNYGGAPSQQVGTCVAGDGFLLLLDATGRQVLFGTLLGGAGNDRINSISVEGGGVLSIRGSTSSGSGFPVTVPSPPPTGSAFGARIDLNTPALLNSEFLGMPSEQPSVWRTPVLPNIGARVETFAEASDGAILLVGSANSFSDSLKAVNAIQPANAGFSDAWVAKLLPVDNTRITAVNAASFAGPEIAPGSIATLYSGAVGSEVLVRDTAARVIASDGNQTSIIVPDGLAPGLATVSIVRDGQQVATGALIIHHVAPAIFTANSDGRGAPAAQVVRVSRNGTRSEQSPFVCSDRCIPAAVDASDDEAESVLVLYGTGIRNRTSTAGVKVMIADHETPVEFGGPHSVFEGLDQVNVRLPSFLRERGDVNLVLVVDGRLSNAVTLRIR